MVESQQLGAWPEGVSPQSFVLMVKDIAQRKAWVHETFPNRLNTIRNMAAKNRYSNALLDSMQSGAVPVTFDFVDRCSRVFLSRYAFDLTTDEGMAEMCQALQEKQIKLQQTPAATAAKAKLYGDRIVQAVHPGVKKSSAYAQRTGSVEGPQRLQETSFFEACGKWLAFHHKGKMWDFVSQVNAGQPVSHVLSYPTLLNLMEAPLDMTQIKFTPIQKQRLAEVVLGRDLSATAAFEFQGEVLKAVRHLPDRRQQVRPNAPGNVSQR